MWDARGSHVLVFKRLNREFLRGAMPLQRMLRTGEDARPLAHLRLVCEHWGYFRALRKVPTPTMFFTRLKIDCGMEQPHIAG